MNQKRAHSDACTVSGETLHLPVFKKSSLSFPALYQVVTNLEHFLVDAFGLLRLVRYLACLLAAHKAALLSARNEYSSAVLSFCFLAPH